MVRGLVMATAALLLAATSADAGLFSRGNSCGGCAAPAPVVVSGCGGCDSCAPVRKVKFRKTKRRDCCAPVAPSCCAPVVTTCAAPAPVCAAPAPTCCAPRATCCAPAPAACGACAPAAAVAPMPVGDAPKPKDVVDAPPPPQ